MSNAPAVITSVLTDIHDFIPLKSPFDSLEFEVISEDDPTGGSCQLLGGAQPLPDPLVEEIKCGELLAWADHEGMSESLEFTFRRPAT